LLRPFICHCFRGFFNEAFPPCVTGFASFLHGNVARRLSQENVTMETKSKTAMPNRKQASLTAENPPFAIKGRPIVLATPPEEIADGGEVRLGCSALDGRFPLFRR
jgi:hypothetical protein